MIYVKGYISSVQLYGRLSCAVDPMQAQQLLLGFSRLQLKTLGVAVQDLYSLDQHEGPPTSDSMEDMLNLFLK